MEDSHLVSSIYKSINKDLTFSNLLHIKWALSNKYLTLLHENIKSTEQPAHPRSLISAFDIRYLERRVANLALCKVFNTVKLVLSGQNLS